MRALVTGAGGSIGREVAQALKRDGFTVRGVDRVDSMPDLDEVLVGDCSSYEFAQQVTRDIDVLVHLAAVPSPDPVHPETTFVNNTQVTFNVAYAAAGNGVGRIVAASSISVLGLAYSPADSPSVAYVPIDEAIPIAPADTYALSKETDEATLRMVSRRFGLSTIAFRMPFVGTSEQLLELGTQARADPATRSRELWSYLHMEDAARAFSLACRADLGADPHVLNIVAPNALGATDIPSLLPLYFPDVAVRGELNEGAGAYSVRLAEQILQFRAQRCWCGETLSVADHPRHGSVSALL